MPRDLSEPGGLKRRNQAFRMNLGLGRNYFAGLLLHVGKPRGRGRVWRGVENPPANWWTMILRSPISVAFLGFATTAWALMLLQAGKVWEAEVECRKANLAL